MCGKFALFLIINLREYNFVLFLLIISFLNKHHHKILSGYSMSLTTGYCGFKLEDMF